MLCFPQTGRIVAEKKYPIFFCHHHSVETTKTFNVTKVSSGAQQKDLLPFCDEKRMILSQLWRFSSKTRGSLRSTLTLAGDYIIGHIA